jgi:hypothetical protein
LLHPRLAAVVSAAQETAVATNPATLAVEKVDGVEIVATRIDLERHPAILCLRGAGDTEKHNDGSKKL